MIQYGPFLPLAGPARCWAQGWRRIIRKGNRSRHAPALLAEMLDLWSTVWDLGLPKLGLPNNDFFAEFERNCQKTCTYIRALQLLPASKVGEHPTRRAGFFVRIAAVII